MRRVAQWVEDVPTNPEAAVPERSYLDAVGLQALACESGAPIVVLLERNKPLGKRRGGGLGTHFIVFVIWPRKIASRRRSPRGPVARRSLGAC